MSAVVQRSETAAWARSARCLFRRRLMSRSDVKRTQCAGRSQNWQSTRGGRA